MRRRNHFKTRVGKILQEEGATIFPGVFDPLGAKIAVRAGFPAIFISGYSVSATHLGEPDFGLLTQTEMIAAARRVCRAVKVPVIVDADTGYGNALNVIRTVRELIDAGAAGMFLEDQLWPKRCGHMRGKKVIPLGEQLAKLSAAIDARAGRDFFIVARTDARQVKGLDDAIARVRAYKKAGADAVFVEAPQSVEEMKRVAKSVEGPLVANMLEGGVTPLLTRKELADLGYDFIVSPLTALYASAKAMAELFKIIRSKETTREDLGRLLKFKEFHEIIDLEGYYRLDDRYRS